MREYEQRKKEAKREKEKERNSCKRSFGVNEESDEQGEKQRKKTEWDRTTDHMQNRTETKEQLHIAVELFNAMYRRERLSHIRRCILVRFNFFLFRICNFVRILMLVCGCARLCESVSFALYKL